MIDFQIIHDQIAFQRFNEDSKYFINKALARLDCIINEKAVTLWLFNSLQIQNIRPLINVINIIAGQNNHFLQGSEHKAFSKNSPVGIKIQTTIKKKIKYTLNGVEHTLKILNFTNYNPYAYDSDAKDIHIKDLKTSKEYRFNRLKSLQNAIKTGSIHGDHRLIKDFVRITNQLRYQSILDPIQSIIKVSNIFNNKVLIIEGGPGTGKTTSLIHRIKYLTDPIVHQEKYNEDNLNLKWVFLSPNKSLSRFLEHSMYLENLSVNQNTLVIWEEKKIDIGKKLEIVSDGSSGFFELYNSDKSLFYKDERRINLPNEMERQLDQYVIQGFNETIKKILNSKKYNSILRSEIINYLISVKVDTILSLIQVLNNLQKTYKIKIKKETSNLAKILDQEVRLIYQNIKDDKELITLIAKSKNKNVDIESTLLIGDFKDFNKQNEDLIFKYLKSFLIYYYQNEKINNKSHKEIYQRIRDKISRNSNTEAMILIRSEFTNITNGPIIYLINGLNKYYDNFRKKSTFLKLNVKHEVSGIIKSKERFLFFEELNFLIGYKVRMINNIQKLSTFNKNSKENDLIATVNDISYNVIGVDECTDYSIFDYYAINSLLKKGKYSSLTLCGDLMQKMVLNGINEWDELRKIFGDNLDVKTLFQSHRQSSTLINVAKKVYLTSLGKELNLKPKFEKFDDEPVPIMFNNPDLIERIKWVHSCINEIKKSYEDEFPSVAIFLTNPKIKRDFLKKINLLPKIENLSIKDGDEVENNALNIIRVYDISLIKGLEFHAAIIFDLDELSDNVGSEVVNTTIYVALSRAAFYLGITTSKPLKYLHQFGFKEDTW